MTYKSLSQSFLKVGECKKWWRRRTRELRHRPYTCLGRHITLYSQFFKFLCDSLFLSVNKYVHVVSPKVSITFELSHLKIVDFINI